MSKLTPQMIENAKQMIVNLEVAKTMDRKTQTRRLIKSDSKEKLSFSELHKMKDNEFVLKNGEPVSIGYGAVNEDGDNGFLSKYQMDNILWVREPVQITRFDDIIQQYDYQYVSDGQNIYQADIPKKYKRHNNPKWMKNLYRVPNGCLKTMARHFVKITNVRVERLQDITYEDILAEGCPKITAIGSNIDALEFKKRKAKEWWIDLWNSTAPKGYKWEDNPYVFVYEFERVER